jgi:hypothetical protein
MFPSTIYMWQWTVINSSDYVHCRTGVFKLWAVILNVVLFAILQSGAEY